MNIRQNPTVQQRRSPQAKPQATNTSAQALAEQLKAEGEQEAARGEQLQKDGVELQSEGANQQARGEDIVEAGEFIKSIGESEVQRGQEIKAEGQAKVDSGIEAESTARQAEAQHTEAFQVGLDAGTAANQSSAETLEKMQASMDSEKAANQADAKSLSDYEGHLTLAGLAVKANEVVHQTVTAAQDEEKAAQQAVSEATTGYIAGVDGQAEGRSIQMDGRNDVRVADDLKAQSEQATNRAKSYLDRAVGHLEESMNLKEEVESHGEASSEYTTQAGIADAMGQSVSGQADEQSAISALLAAKAAIDAEAASGLSDLSHFESESKRTAADSALAFGQSVAADQRSKFYSNAAAGLAEEAGQFNSMAGLEDQQAARKTDQSSALETLAFGDAKRAVDHFGNARDLDQRSGEVRERGEGKIADGTAKHAAATEVAEENLAIIADGTARQGTAHDIQKVQIDLLQANNHGLAVSLETRQGILSDLAASNQAQGQAQADQSTGVESLKVDQRLGTTSMEQRQAASEGIKSEGANVSAALGTQQEGFTQRKEGGEVEELGGIGVRVGEEVIGEGESQIAEGEKKAEEGRQKEEAGKVIADKGQKYQELAQKAAQEVPFHVAK